MVTQSTRPDHAGYPDPEVPGIAPADFRLGETGSLQGRSPRSTRVSAPICHRRMPRFSASKRIWTPITKRH